MLDQSFSAKNFRILFDIVNRNGLFVDDKLSLTSIRAHTTEIKGLRSYAKKITRPKKMSGQSTMKRLTEF